MMSKLNYYSDNNGIADNMFTMSQVYVDPLLRATKV